LADRLEVTTLQNFITHELDAIREDWHSIAYQHISYVYDNTCEKQGLRDLLFLQCVEYLPFSTFSENPDAFPKEMLWDYVLEDKLCGRDWISPFKDEEKFRRRFYVPVLLGEVGGRLPCRETGPNIRSYLSTSYQTLMELKE
jgi:hypothetical protein